jgi:hypothetical protein
MGWGRDRLDQELALPNARGWQALAVCGDGGVKDNDDAAGSVLHQCTKKLTPSCALSVHVSFL